MNKSKKQNTESFGGLFSWAMYDWANSAFFTIILTFVFAQYFSQSVVGDEVAGTEAEAEAQNQASRRLIRRDRRAETDSLAMLGSVGARQTAATSSEAILLPTQHLGGSFIDGLVNQMSIMRAGGG